MPTGYTADVVDGKITEFKDFALSCARAFGALANMRDDPMDAPIPDEIKPNSYCSERLEATEDELKKLLNLSIEDSAIEAEKEYNEAFESTTKYRNNLKLENERIDTMIEKVLNWRIPTSDHRKLYEFMIEQLSTSKSNYEPEMPKRLSVAEWRTKKLKELTRDFDYYGKQVDEENQRAADKTKWIQALKNSL